ncbi:H-NS family nucleoid-associated regulatory protein [Cupriavidus basilensis]|uniref:H-NS family nucleoid-associated regulatory protein n=1 Tax=Cupriavidus basilensis TaxID=68895 RepID=UPI0009E31161
MPKDVARKRRGRHVAAMAKAKSERLPARYRGPKTGKTWSGRGRAPTWEPFAAEVPAQSLATISGSRQ